MSALLLALVLCEAKLTSHFELYATEAARVYANLPAMTVEVKTLPNKLGGQTILGTKHVVLSPRLCQFDDLVIDSIIMHEIGHVVAHEVYPDLKVGPTHEALADQFAARLWNKSEFLLEKLQTMCSEGDKWSCEKHTSWQYGMTH